MEQDLTFNYRQELKGILSERRSRNPNYSIRALARDLQVSVTALHGVLSGDRHLSKKNLNRLALRLGWSPQKLASASESQFIVEDPTESRLSEDRFAMIADWVHLAILNLVKLPQMTQGSLSQRLGISNEVCDSALERLIRLDFIEVNENGILSRKIPSFGTTDNIPSAAIRTFHFNNLKKAQDIIETIPVEEREFQTIAAVSNPYQINELKKLIKEFRTKALEMFSTPDPQEVYFLNIQLYPVTRSKD